MNICVLKGNIVRDVELKFAAGNGVAIAKFNIAVARMKKEDGADFINCVAFGKTAETIANYFTKGSPILIEGHIRTGLYENKEGKKVYTTDIIVNRFEFINKKKENDNIDKEMKIVDDGSDIPF